MEGAGQRGENVKQLQEAYPQMTAAAMCNHIPRMVCRPQVPMPVSPRAAEVWQRILPVNPHGPAGTEGWAGEPHECECSSPDDSCPACSAIGQGGQ